MRGTTGKKVKGTSPTRKTTKGPRIQRGTNCPVGKQEEDKQEQGQVRGNKAFVRHLPG